MEDFLQNLDLKTASSRTSKYADLAQKYLQLDAKNNEIRSLIAIQQQVLRILAQPQCYALNGNLLRAITEIEEELLDIIGIHLTFDSPGACNVSYLELDKEDTRIGFLRVL